MFTHPEDKVEDKKSVFDTQLPAAERRHPAEASLSSEMFENSRVFVAAAASDTLCSVRLGSARLGSLRPLAQRTTAAAERKPHDQTPTEVQENKNLSLFPFVF